jgi:hypothetical protein
LSHVGARGIVVVATVGKRLPVRLALACANLDQVPFLLGQFNFFQTFDVCFFRTWKSRNTGPGWSLVIACSRKHCSWDLVGFCRSIVIPLPV